MNIHNLIIEKSKETYNKTVNIRREIHRNPELSFKEFKTTRLIKEVLDDLNIENFQLTDTGVIGIIGDKNKKCIALRADIDALPIEEETQLEYASKTSGVMHACGHDMHTAMLLGAAQVLKSIESELNGCIKLIFQPAEEELPGGANVLIRKGVLDNPNVEAIFGQHINPLEETGKISLASGPVMASTDELYWTISGKGAHAAQPHKANDPISTAAQLILYYQTMLVKFRNPLDAGVLTVASINGGNTTNIFPDKVEMQGTLRTYNQIWRQEMLTLITEKSKLVGEMYNTNVDIQIVNGYPATINDDYITELIRNNTGYYFNENEILDFEPKMWAEDFAYYLQRIKGTFWFLGVKPKNTDNMVMLHNSKLAPDEKAMLNGIIMLAGTAYSYFND